jgi:acyl dehydratase
VTSTGRSRLNAALVGKEYPQSTFDVTPESIASYARATNDLNEAYLAGDRAVASPVWPVVPAFGAFMAAARDPELGVDLRRLLHASEEHVLHAPIHAGDVLSVSARLEGVEHRVNGDAFTVAVTERRGDGSIAAQVRGTLFVRGAGRAPLDEGVVAGDVVHEHRMTVDSDQMRRYADASEDRNPIHLDPRAARLSGLRAPILHGMCTMAMATKGAVDGLAAGDPTRVARVAVTFSRPVVPGQELTTRFWVLQELTHAVTYRFETTTGEGATVITGAEVEIRAR